MTVMAQPAAPMSPSALAQLTLSLVAIVGLIFVIAWALRRLRASTPRGRGDLAVVGDLSLSPHDRIVLVRIGDQQVLVGIGTGGLVGLTPLSAPIALSNAAPLPPFADRLREFMKRPGTSQ